MKMATKAKIQSWRDLVTEEGNKEPWGIVYETVTGKLRRKETMFTLRTPQGDTSNWRCTVAAILSALIPDEHLEAKPV